MPSRANNSKATELAAARARAKAWRDCRRNENTGAPKSASKKTPSRSESKTKTASSANATGAGANAVQYRKTPSRQERAEARATARAKARAWSQSKQGTPSKKKRVSLGIPSVIDCDEKSEDSAEDFETAIATEFKTAQTQAGAASLGKRDLQELGWMVNDMGNSYERLKGFLEKHSEATSSDIMDLD